MKKEKRMIEVLVYIDETLIKRFHANVDILDETMQAGLATFGVPVHVMLLPCRTGGGPAIRIHVSKLMLTTDMVDVEKNRMLKALRQQTAIGWEGFRANAIGLQDYLTIGAAISPRLLDGFGYDEAGDALE